MNDAELSKYIEQKKKEFTSPDSMTFLHNRMQMLCSLHTFEFEHRVLIRWTFEYLCFTIHTPEGSSLYIKLLSHITKKNPDIAAMYWEIFDNQEKIHERYRKT